MYILLFYSTIDGLKKKMLVLKDNERLYPDTWSYNGARIMSKLAEVVVENGGRVKPCKKAVISNRSIEDMKMKISEKIDLYKSLEEKTHKDLRAAAIEKKEKELKELEGVKNDPIVVTHTSYISFIYDNTYYYYQMDDNPFFEFLLVKTPIKNNKYSRDAALEETKKTWLEDQFLKIGCSEKDINDAAKKIFDMLVSSKNSSIILDKKRVRVQNLYNSGYHYETIYGKERFASVEF